MCCERCRGKPTSWPTSSTSCRPSGDSRIDARLAAAARPGRGSSRIVLEALGQRVDAVQRQAQGLAHVAHRRARPVGDHLGRHAGPLAAVLLVEILQHLLAALVLEIDVDVRGLVPLAADEPLEEHVHPLGIDRRDAQAVADGRIGRRAAALAENAPPPGESHQVPDGEEIGLVVQLARSAAARARAGRRTFSGTPPRIALAAPRPRRAGRDTRSASRPAGPVPRDTRSATRRAKTCSARRFPACGATASGASANRRGHFLGRFQMPLGVGETDARPPSATVHAVADGRQHVVQRPALGHVIMHVAGRHQRHARARDSATNSLQLAADRPARGAIRPAGKQRSPNRSR